MGEHLRNVKVNDPLADKSLTTKGDIKAMEENVRGWCDMAKKHFDDALHLKQTETDTAMKELREFVRDELATVRGIMDDYRVDELRYRNMVSPRGRAIRFRNWLVCMVTLGMVRAE